MKVTWQSPLYRRTALVLLALFILSIFTIGQVVLPAQAQTTNLALNRPVTCSSTENTSYPCTAAVDGSSSTRWSSAFADPQWIYVDLGATTTINRVVLNWEAAYGRSYQIQVGSSTSSWTTIYSTTTGNGATDDLVVSGSGRYVRMYGTARATVYGYSLWEFQVYGGGTPPPTTPPPTTQPGQAPYGGTAAAVPGTVQAENYDTGGEAVAYHDTETANQGGAYRTDGVDIEATTDTGGGNNVGWTAAGEWLEYTINVTAGGTYTLSARTASQSGGGSMHAEIDGTNVTGTMAIPSTGAWQTWTTVTSGGFSLTSGQHVLRIAIDGAGFNLNWVSLQTGVPPTTPPPTTPPPCTAPNWGSNVRVFNPTMSASTIQSSIDSVYNAQQNNHFGDRRDALLFMPGTYNVNIGVGFYTEVLGLGANPDAVRIAGSNANLHSDSYLSGNNSTQNFWRGATNFSVQPNNGTVKWATSQAIWFRQMHVLGNIALHQNGGWASGGWMSNTRIDNNVDAGPQQQWITRNTQMGSWTGSNWNHVYVGVVGAPSGNWPSPTYTRIATTPIVREKPFLMADAAGNYSVRVPSLKSNSSSYDWSGGSVPGTTIPICDFYIAHAGDSAATINSQLAAGRHLILTPGIYAISSPIQVTRANTIVLGMGLATLRPTTGQAAMTIGDVDGVTVSGVLFDAGTTNSPILLEVGTQGNSTSHASNPIVLHDVIFRVGGAAAGKATVSFRINANDTIVDHTWVWRADHGTGVGWTSNTGANGLVVNGNNVTIYGLFVEHYQQFQTLWNGNGGRVYFYQSEIPYDPPNQAGWMSASGVNGWASYKVGNNVTSHQAWGLGIYSVFSNGGIYLSRAIEVPNNTNVRFTNMITVCLGSNGGIQNVINSTGGSTTCNVGFTPKVLTYP